MKQRINEAESKRLIEQAKQAPNWDTRPANSLSSVLEQLQKAMELLQRIHAGIPDTYSQQATDALLREYFGTEGKCSPSDNAKS